MEGKRLVKNSSVPAFKLNDKNKGLMNLAKTSTLSNILNRE
jgi:hypothetical protein